MTFPARLFALVLLLAFPVATGFAAEKPKAVSPTRPANASSAKSAPSSNDYLGAIVIDAGNGAVLWEDHADVSAMPASVTKLMNLLLLVEAVEAGKVRLTDPVTVTREIAGMGGTQVFLKEGETFTVEELAYAMMIQSANDAALALAIHVGGGRDAFVAAMNARAAQLGMTRTRYVTPHGLVSPKQEADVSTPRDIAALSREVVRHPLALKFTAEKKRTFRQEPLLVMENHNKLLGVVAGCDGLKTGYLTRAGHSLAATVYRDGKRVIAVVMGSKGVFGRQAAAIAGELIAGNLPKAGPAPAEMHPREPDPEPAVPAGVSPVSGDAAPAPDGVPEVKFRVPGAAPKKN